MRRLLLASTALFALAATLPAQETGPPIPELKRYKAALGKWEGRGTVVMVPGTDASSWTATVTAKPILNGQFVESVMRADIGGGVIYEMRNLFGWDSNTDQPVGVMLTNMDGGTALASRWVDDRTQVILHSGVDEQSGQPYADHWVNVYDADTFSMEIHRALGKGKPFLHITGQFRRMKDGSQGSAAAASMGLVPPPPMMQKLRPMLGHYAVSGKMAPAPGLPDVKFSGHETIEPAMGGQVLSFHTTGGIEGAPPDYEALAYLYWNAADKCYKFYGMNNMGEVHTVNGYWIEDDKLIFTGSGLMQGAPAVMRNVMHVDAEKGVTKTEAHTMVGAGPATKIFESKYSPIE